MRRLPQSHRPDVDDSARAREELAIAKELLRRVGERSLDASCAKAPRPAKSPRRRTRKSGARH